MSPCIYETEGKLFCFRHGNLISECINNNNGASTTIKGAVTTTTKPENKAILITGGEGGFGASQSAEIYNPVTKYSCILPQLPNERKGHTQDGPLLCGTSSINIGKTCLTWNSESGTWPQSHNLYARKYGHVSWAPESGHGIYLLGGEIDLSNPRQTETIYLNGTVTNGIDLKRDWT